MFPSSPRQWLWPPLLLIALLTPHARAAAGGCYTSIFSFGDSLTDNGNYLPSCVAGRSRHKCCQTPYGVTYFHRPTGRFSDGRIIIDFIAQAMGMPFVKPYLGKDSEGEGFRRGANFEVGGATALDSGFFTSRGLEVTWTNYSLGVQLGWFKKLLPTLCTIGPDCDHLLGNSPVLMGEIGGNDYNHALFAGRSLDEIMTYVPHVISTIGSAITELVGVGARTLLVPGNFPIECLPSYLTLFPNSSKEYYCEIYSSDSLKFQLYS